jgi:hypothetical protein
VTCAFTTGAIKSARRAGHLTNLFLAEPAKYIEASNPLTFSGENFIFQNARAVDVKHRNIAE